MVFRVFIFIFCLESKREWVDRTTSVPDMISFLESVIPKVVDHRYYDAHLTKAFERQLKILRTWVNISVEPAPGHLTYYCMLLSLKRGKFLKLV